MCGLFGYVASENKLLNWDKFNILGWDNDSRGRDSVGRMVGNEVHKWINPKSTITNYKDYVIKFNNTAASNIAIGHTRKASSGDKTIDHAQPIVLDIDDDLQFAMVHNGTLHNHVALASKYNVDPTGKTDSMILAEIIMNNGFGVLSEYRGAAAIIIKDDRVPNTLYVFRGSSKIYNGTLDGERPLYFYQESDDSMYISSKDEGLFFIADNNAEQNEDGDAEYAIQSFDTNILYTITNGQVVDEVEIDRSRMYQSKFNSTTYGYGNSNYNNNKNTVKGFDTSKLFDYTKRGNQGNDVSPLDHNKQYDKDWSLNRQFMSELTTTNTDTIQFARMRYWISEKLANGQLILNKEGKILRAKKQPGYKVFYFYAGVMVKDKASYNKLNKELGKHKYFKESKSNTSTLSKYALHPICTLVDPMEIKEFTGDMRRTFVVDPEQPTALYTGEVHPYFSKYIYNFRNGDCRRIEYIGLNKYDNIDEEDDEDTTELDNLTEAAKKVDEQYHCSNCKGSGISPNTGKMCLLCNGTGVKKMAPISLPATTKKDDVKDKDCSVKESKGNCAACKGEGTIDTGHSLVICDECNGTGEADYYGTSSITHGTEDAESEDADAVVLESRLGNQGFSTKDAIEQAFEEDAFFNDEADNLLSDLAINVTNAIDRLQNAGYDSTKAQTLISNLTVIRERLSEIPEIVENPIKIKFKYYAF
jgi:predicted glutamine amidotransferase